MANQPTLDPNTAPRDPAEYDTIQPFKIRMLTDKLGGLNSAEKMAAWHQLQGKPAQVEYLLTLLKEWDAKHANGTNGGATHVAPIAPSTVAAVRPDATAAAASAAAPSAAKKPARSPVSTLGSSLQTAPAPSAATPATAPDVNLGTAVLIELDEIKKAVTALGQLVAQLDSAVKAKESPMEAFGALMDRLDGMVKVQTWTLTSLLTMAENSMGAAPLDMLRSAMTDADSLMQIIDKVRAELGK